MDPLSIASGIAGLLVLAMQIVDGSSEFVSSYRALPDEARKLWDDFQGLYLVIKRLEALRKELQGGNVLQPFLEAVEEGDLPSILASLETSLCRIQRLTKSYGKMASSMKLKIQWLVIGRYEAVKIRRMTANDKDTLVVLLSIVQTRTLNLMQQQHTVMPNMKLFQKSAPIESLVVPKRVYSFLEDEAKDDPSDNYNGSLGDTSWKIVEDECGQIPIDKDQIPKLLRFKDTFTVFSGTVQRYFSNLYGHGDHHVKKLLRKLDEIDERIKLLIEACANKIVGPQYDISFERYDRECLEFGAKLEKFMSKHDEQRLQQLSAAECEQWRREGSFLVEEYNNELLKWTLSLSTMVVDARNTYKYNYAGKADGIPVAGDSAKIQECLAFALQDLTDLGKSLESGDLSKWLKSPLWFFFKCTERQLRDALEGMQGRTSPNKSDGLAVKRPPPSNESGIACWETCYEVIKVWQGPEAMCCSYIRSLIGCLYTEQKDLKKGAEYLNCAIRRKASMLPGWAPTEFHDIHAELQLGILYFKEMSVEEHAALRKSKEHIERALKGLDNCEAKANVQLKQNDEADNWKAAKMVALFYMAELHRRLKFCAPDRRESIKKAEVAMRECGFDDAAIEKAWMDD